jgi:hypothetical protein
VKRELSGRQLTEELDDKTLPICWRGRRPFKSLKDVRKYFKPLALSFINGGKAKIQFELPPEAYLIISVIPVPSFLVSVATLCQNSKLTNNMLSLSLSLYIYIYIYKCQSKGNVCLGILNGTEQGQGTLNIIGGNDWYII